MGKVKKSALLSENENEIRIQKAMTAYAAGKSSSLRKAAEVYGLAYTTLYRRVHGSLTRVQGHAHQQLLSAAEERAILHWIIKLEEWGFPPWIEHVKEAVILPEAYWPENETIGKNWITRFLNRHPELVSKYSSQFDKKRMKANDPDLIQSLPENSCSSTKL